MKVKVAQSCLTLCDSMDFSWNSLGQNIGAGSLSLLQGTFPAQGLNPGLLHCGRILCQLSHKGSSRILEWVAYPFSCGSSQPRNQTGVSCFAGRFFTNWAIREAQSENHSVDFLFGSLWPHGLHSPWNSPGQKYTFTCSKSHNDKVSFIQIT